MTVKSQDDSCDDLQSKAQEHLQSLERQLAKPSSAFFDEEGIIHTPGHFIELNISMTQRTHVNMLSIRFNSEYIELSTLYYPNNKYASPVPHRVKISSLIGWHSDNRTIRLALSDERPGFTILKPASETLHVSKLVNIAKALKVLKIPYISNKDECLSKERTDTITLNTSIMSESDKSLKQIVSVSNELLNQLEESRPYPEQNDKLRLSNKGKNLTTANIEIYLFRNLQTGAPTRIWSNVSWNNIQLILLAMSGVCIIEGIRSNGWGLAVSTLFTTAISLVALPY